MFEGQGKQQEQKIRIELSQLTDVVCEAPECGNKTFVPQMLIKKLSALLSPSGKEEIIPIQIFACAKCGHVNDQFQPKQVS